MNIAIPVYDGVDMLDVAGPFEMFDWAGFEIDVLAAQPGLTKFRSQGFSFVVSKEFSNTRPYDAIWVPGGDPAALMAIINDPAGIYLRFLVAQAKQTKMICSVCEGAMLLAAAGLLDGYEATTHWAYLSCFAQMFPKVVVAAGHPRFILDRNRLTGGGISSGLDEALKLVDLLGGAELAKKVQQNTQYYPDPPVTSALPRELPRCPILRSDT